MRENHADLRRLMAFLRTIIEQDALASAMLKESDGPNQKLLDP